MATGVGFSFDTSFLKNLEKADKQMDELMKKSNQASRSIISAFQQMTQRGVVPFVESLEKEKRTLEAVSAALTTRSGKVRKGYEEMAQSVMNTINVLTKLESKVKSTTQYKEGVANRDAERDLATYKQLVVEIQRLNEIKRQALGAQSSGDPTLRADATRTLQEANRQLQNAQKQAQGIKIKYAQETAAIERDISMRGFQTRLNQMVSAEERLNQRRLAWVRDVDAAQARAEQNKLNRINKRFEIEERRERRSAEKEERRLNTPQGALEYARGLKSGVKSIDTMNLALQRLKNAQNGLDRNTKGWQKKYKEIQKEINAIEKELGKVHTTQRGLMDTSGQLARAMAAVFSVSAIKGYVNKLMQIRGEFELQQRSLQVLLQNKAEANELWDKTVALAVKSPLTTKQLVTSTKQLAAYRIESDKLYETNKMLADVSQGLGVDMNRLILAFGQVKAASFLRGTELRQFSEAGVNMLDELANHFEKLEGRAVSVAEVFERVSKRMVTFEDVEAVFKNITSKGGTFYQMQEKQSKTLRGMMLNLKDSYELMLNEIGEEQEGLLKGFINLMRELVRSWRELAPLIKTAGLSFLAYFSFSKIAQLVTWFNNLAVAIRGVGVASAMATKINPWVALATVITAVAVAAYELSTAVSEFEAISVSVNKEVTEIFTEQVALYKELADKYHDATTSEEERKEILGELQQKYKEILPDMYTELEYIEAHAGHYQAAEEAMRSYYNSMAIERKKSKIMASHEESLYQTDIPELADAIRGSLVMYEEYEGLTKLETNKLSAQIDAILGEAVEEYLSGARVDFKQNVADKINEYIGREVVSGRGEVLKYGSDYLREQWWDILKELETTKRELGSVSGLAFRTMDDELDNAEIEAIKKRIKEVEEAYKTLSGIYKQLSQGKLEAKDVEEKVKAPMKVLVDAFGEEEAKGIEENLKNISNSVYDFTVGLNGVTVGFYNQLAAFAKTRPSLAKSLLDSMGLSVGENPLVDVLSQNLKDTEKEYGNIQKEVLNVFEEVRDKFNLSSEDMNVFATLFPDDSKTLSDVRTNLSGKIEQLTGDIKLYKNAVESGNPNENPLGFKDEDVKKWEKQIKWLQLALDMLGGDSKKKEKGDEQLKILNRRISLVKEMYNEYVKLHERFNADDAEKKVASAYKDTFKDAFEGTGINFSGLVINKEKLVEVQQEGAKAGTVFSESMLQKMEEVLNAGTYIRNASDAFKEQLKGDEGLMLQLYDDSTKNIIKNAEDFKNSVGTVTIGFGHAITKLEEAEKYFGKTLTEQEANELFEIDVSKHIDALNAVLDKQRELILTQEQYDALLNATYQGGAGMVRSAIEYATNEDSALAHFALLDEKLKKVGLTFEQEFGADFVDRFKNAENASERLALALETVGLTTKASGSNIDKNLYSGMKRRSAERAAAFRGDLELVELLYKASVDVSQIDFTNVAGVVDILKQLVPIAEKEGKEAELALSKEISKWEAEIKLDAKIRADKRFDEDIERLFGNYELSLELEKLNIPKDLASRLFGIDSIDLTSLRKEILDRAGLGDMENQANKDILKSKAYENLEEHRQTELANSLQKVEKMEREHQEKLLKQYSKYLVQAQSERLKLKLGELKQLAEIEKTFTMTEQIAKSENIGMDDNQWNAYKKMLAENKEINEERLKQAGFEDDIIKKIIEQNKLLKEQGEIAKEGVSREVREQIAKAEWEAFEKSPEIVSMFSDLDRLSNTALKGLLSQLETLKTRLSSAGLPASELKDILSRIAQIEEEIGERNPFAGWGGSEEKGDGVFSYFKNRKAFENARKTLTTKREELNKAEDELVAYQKNTSTIEWSVEKYNELSSAESDATKEVEESEKAFQDAETKYNRSARAVDQLNTAYHSLKDGLNEVADSAQDMLSNLGVLSEEDGAIFDGIQSAANNALGAAGNIARIAINPADIGAWVGAFSSVMGLISDIAGVGDARKEKQIQKEIKLVERLGKLYEKLEKQIEAAYSIDTFQAANDAAKENLEQQIRATERMIEAEYDKKDTDYKRIEEWREQIEENLEMLKELEAKRLQELGGVGGEDYYKDAAQSFVDAWIEAFLATGDGLSGLLDEFDEFYKESIGKQLALRAVDAYLDDYFQDVDTWVDQLSKGLITPEEYAKFMERAAQEAAIGTDAILKPLANAFNLASTAEQNLGSLSAGIQGISESQADTIAAYLNSLRFYVADSNTQLKALVAAQVNTDTPNPMLSQLLVIAEQTRAIRDMFESVIGRGGNNKHGGAYLKVDIG